MKKLTLVLALVLFANYASASQPAELSKGATIVIPVIPYAAEAIDFTTATATDLTCTLISSASSTNVDLENTGFEAVGDGYNIFLPSNLLDQIGHYKCKITHAECITVWENIEVVSSDAYWENKNGISGKIVEVTTAISTVDTNVDSILVDTGTTIPATIVDVTNAIIASGNIIPTTGILLHDIPTLTHAGATPYNYMFSGVSRYATPPHIAIAMQDTVAGYNLYATETAFTHVASQSYMNTVAGEDVWEHVWFYTINTNTLPFGNYKVFVHTTSMDYPVAAMGSLIHSTTPTVDLDGIPTESWTAENVIHPASQVAERLLSGYPNDWTVYRAVTPNTRTVAELSSAANRSYATGSEYGVQIIYPNFYESAAGLLSDATKWFVYDEDDSWLDSKSARGRIYEVTTSIPAYALIEDVTVTSPGD